MLDLQFICDNREAVEENCRRRGVTCDVARLVELRQQRGEIISAGDALRHEQKEIAGKIPQASSDERPALIERGKQLKEEVAANEAGARAVEAELRDLQSAIPNITHPDRKSTRLNSSHV